MFNIHEASKESSNLQNFPLSWPVRMLGSQQPWRCGALIQIWGWVKIGYPIIRWWILNIWHILIYCGPIGLQWASIERPKNPHMSLSLPKHFFPWSLHVKAKAKSVGRPRGSTNREAYGAYGMGGFPLSPPAPWHAPRPALMQLLAATLLKAPSGAMLWALMHIMLRGFGLSVMVAAWCANIYIYIHTYICIHIYICMYIYIHVYMGPTGWRLPWQWDRGFPTTKEY